jgi:hypothetical protein
MCTVSAVQAAILVGPNGAGPFTFNTNPLPADIATRVLNGVGSTYTDTATLDVGVQAVVATNVTRALPTDGAFPPGTFSGGFRRNTATNAIQSRPTTDGTNAAQVLVAFLQNNSGGASTTLALSYRFDVQTPAAGHLPGFYVYYSLTGQPNTWVPIPELSGSETPGFVFANVTLTGNWAAGAPLYVLWADDNADGVTDPSYTIDDLFFSAQPLDPHVRITQQPAGTTVDEGFSATFTVFANGQAPLSYQWFRDGILIPGATSSVYTIPRVFRSDSGAIFTVEVSNGVPSSETSSGATLTVRPDNVGPRIECVYGTNDNVTLFVVYSEIVTNAIDPVNYTVFPTGGGDPLTVTNAVYGNGGTVEGNVVVLTLDGSTPWVGPNSYSLTAGGVFDVVGNPNDPSQIVPVSLYATTLFSITQPPPLQNWTFNDSGTDLGTAWRLPGYNDSTWQSGPALLGFETAAIPEPLRTPTVRLDVNGTVIRTFYFRTHFNFAGPAGRGVLRFRTVLDDAVVLYLNGAEVWRLRMPPGPVDYLTGGAGGAVGDAVYEGPFSVCVSNLVVGDNVLAAEVHQTGDASSDMLWGLEFGIAESTVEPLTIISQPTGTNVTEPTPFTLRVVARGSNPQYQWYHNDQPITGATGPAYVVNPSNCDVDSGTYYVIVSNPLGSITSSTVTVNVACDVTPPRVTCLYGTNDVIVITFSEMTTNAAGYPDSIFNYVINPPLSISSVSYSSGTNIGTTALIVIDPNTPRDPNTAYSIEISGAEDLFGNPMNPVTLAIPLFPGSPILRMDAAQLWRYDDSDTDRSNTWYAVSYNDSAWPQGAAVFDAKRPPRSPLAVGGEPIRTVTTLSNAAGTVQIPAQYFRTHFNYSGPASATLQIRALLDDGAVFYLNGREILRQDMPLAPTNIVFTTMATRTIGDATNEFLFACVTNLVNGDNVLAVEVHQQSLTSSDITFGAEISIMMTEPPTRLTITPGPGPNQVTVSWTGAGTLQQSSGLSSPSWSNVAGVVGNSYTTTATGSRFFRVRTP